MSGAQIAVLLLGLLAVLGWCVDEPPQSEFSAQNVVRK